MRFLSISLDLHCLHADLLRTFMDCRNIDGVVENRPHPLSLGIYDDVNGLPYLANIYRAELEFENEVDQEVVSAAFRELEERISRLSQNEDEIFSRLTVDFVGEGIIYFIPYAIACFSADTRTELLISFASSA